MVLVCAAALSAAACAGTERSDGPPARPSTATTPSATARATAPVSPSPHGDFSLVVKTAAGDVSANVNSISVASHEPVDIPHKTAKQWNTAAWVRQSSYPSVPSEGTTYIYGHACHHHLCAFTKLKDADVGNQVTITTASGTLNYRIRKIGLSPKAANSLPTWAADSTVPDRVVLVTCGFEQGDTSRQNLVLVAQLHE